MANPFDAFDDGAWGAVGAPAPARAPGAYDHGAYGGVYRGQQQQQPRPVDDLDLSGFGVTQVTDNDLDMLFGAAPAPAAAGSFSDLLGDRPTRKLTLSRLPMNAVQAAAAKSSFRRTASARKMNAKPSVHDLRRLRAIEHANEEDEQGRADMAARAKSGMKKKTLSVKELKLKALNDKTLSFRVVSPKRKPAQPQSLKKVLSFSRTVPVFTVQNSDDMREFLTKPVARSAGTVECYIQRKLNHEGKQVYMLCLNRSKKFIMEARDRAGYLTRGVNFMINMQKKGGRNEPSFVGKVRGNVDMTAFTLYDNGLAPRKARGNMEVRAEHSFVRYTISREHPRTMLTLMPKVDRNEQTSFKVLKPDKFGIAALYNKSGGLDHIAAKKLTELANLEPEWDAQRECHVMDFRGRAKLSSVKNFVLYDKSDKRKRHVLLFGKLEENRFSCDVSHPMSLLQGFGICLSAMVARHDVYI